MGKTHITFRLNDEALTVLQLHKEDLAAVQHRPIDRTEALEDILFKFKERQHSPLADIKRAFRKHPTDEKSIPLEAFKTA